MNVVDYLYGERHGKGKEFNFDGEMTFEGDRVNVDVFDNHFELISNKTYKWDNKFIQRE